MGTGGSRFGAGRPGWKMKAEQSLPLDVRAFHRRGILQPGSICSGSWSWMWTNGEPAGNVGYSFDGKSLRLNFSANGQGKTQSILVTRTGCRFGGSRPWFCCPNCDRRVAVVYHRRGRFACRGCQRIAYLCQSEDAIGRAWRRQRKVEAKLGEGGERPSGMHATTYERLQAVIEECEIVKDNALWQFVLAAGLAQ